MNLLSVDRMQNFQLVTPIDIQLNEEARDIRRQEKEKLENCHIIEVIFDAIRHLAKQNIAFRGHDEESSSKNTINFFEELQFLSKYHEPLREWMEKHQQNCFFSHVSQNDMISVLSSLITDDICNKERAAKYCSI